MKNRMFGGDEPGQADNQSPRTTIVGGRPPERVGALPPVPTGLQRLLRMAAVDDAFRAELLSRRSALAGAAQVELVASERAILDAAPAEQLAAMIASLPPPSTDRRTFLKEGALAALAIVAGTSLEGCEQAGANRPERRNMDSEGGHAPDVPPARPEHPPIQGKGGSRPDRPDAGAPRTADPDAGVARPERLQPTRGIVPKGGGEGEP